MRSVCLDRMKDNCGKLMGTPRTSWKPSSFLQERCVVLAEDVRSFSDIDDLTTTFWKCRIEVEKTRLLVLEAADQLDRHGNKKARGILAMAKVSTPNIALKVLDMAIQVHGTAGVSSDSPGTSVGSCKDIEDCREPSFESQVRTTESQALRT